MESPYTDIGTRIAEFGQSICGTGRGWQSEFGRKLGMKPQAVATYLKGIRKPGVLVLEKLENLGADTYYIRTGKRREGKPVDALTRAGEIARRSREDAMRDGVNDLDVFAEIVKFHLENARTPEQRNRLPYLRMIKVILDLIP